MPTRKITAEEFGRRNPQAKGVFRTTKKGQKVFIAFEKKAKLSVYDYTRKMSLV